jgi:hypothetical protein
MKSIKHLFIGSVLAGLIFVGTAVPAEASLFGDTVYAEFTGGSAMVFSPGSSLGSSLGSAVVGEGWEFDVGFPAGTTITAGTTIMGTIDLDDSSIHITSTRSLLTFISGSSTADSSLPDTLTLSDLDWVGTPGRIVGISLEAGDVTGLASKDISFGDDFVSVLIANTFWASGQSATINLEVVHGTVPESGSTLAMLGLVAAGLMGVHRRRA